MIALGYAFLSGVMLVGAIIEFNHGGSFGWPLAASAVTAALAVAWQR